MNDSVTINMSNGKFPRKTINTTSHAVTINGVTVSPSAISVRAVQENKTIGYRIIVGDDGNLHEVPIIVAMFGVVTIDGLPTASAAKTVVHEALNGDSRNTVVVSLIAYNAMRAEGMRMGNVFIPIGQIRDESGRVVGSRGIGKPS
jgi:hypothetical protein